MRGVLRQLIATGALAVDAQAFNTLQLTEGSRAVLKGERAVELRESIAQPARRGAAAAADKADARRGRRARPTPASSASPRSRPGAPRWRASTTCRPT